MKPSLLLLLVAGAMVAATPVPAQQDQQSPPKGPSVENSGIAGQVPGSTSRPAANQPEMATGEDLKGPPQRFPPDQTPE